MTSSRFWSQFSRPFSLLVTVKAQIQSWASCNPLSRWAFLWCKQTMKILVSHAWRVQRCNPTNCKLLYQLVVILDKETNQDSDSVLSLCNYCTAFKMWSFWKHTNIKQTSTRSWPGAMKAPRMFDTSCAQAYFVFLDAISHSHIENKAYEESNRNLSLQTRGSALYSKYGGARITLYYSV